MYHFHVRDKHTIMFLSTSVDIYPISPGPFCAVSSSLAYIYINKKFMMMMMMIMMIMYASVTTVMMHT